MSGSNVDLILQDFEVRVAQARAKIAESASLQDLDFATELLSQLRNTLASSAYALPAYDVRRAYESLAELGAARERKNETLAPHMPFRFRHRKDRTSTGQKTIRPADSPETVLSRNNPRDSHDGRTSESGPSRLISCNPGHVEISDRTDENCISIDSGDVRTNHVSLLRLNKCSVYMCKVLSALRAVSLTDCRLFIGPVAGSIHLTDCVNCEVHAAAHQIRIHASKKSTFRLRTLSDPIIEECADLLFGGYVLEYQGLDDQLRVAGIGSAMQKKTISVQDFSWLHEGPSPNWSLLSRDQDDVVQFDGAKLLCDT